MVFESSEPCLKMRRLVRGLLGNALASIDLECLDGHRGSNGVAGIGKAVAEYSDLAALRNERVVHRRRYSQPGKRDISRGKGLRHGDGIGSKAERAAAETCPKPAKAADHLVGNYVDIILAADLYDFREIVLRRHDHAA